VLKATSFGISSRFEPPASKLFSSGKGYDLVAEHYDSWAWQDIWRNNEFPIVLAEVLKGAPTLGLLDIGVGTGAFFGYAEPFLSAQLPLVGLDVSAGMLQRARSRLGRRANGASGFATRSSIFGQ